MEGVTTHTEQGTGEPKGHEEAMLNKVDETNKALDDAAGNTGNVAERPDHVPEKFWNAETGEADYEAMSKSYTEMEKKFSQGNNDTDDNDDSDDQEGGDPTDQVQGMDGFANEYMENGELSDESYKALEAQGIDRDTVDEYIAGQEAMAQLRANEVYDLAGGQEQYENMLEWAADNYTPEESAVFDAAIEGDKAGLEMAIRDLKTRFVAENGNEQSLLNGNGQTNTSNGYESWAQVTAAMKDSRYQNDPAYRAEVDRKLAASKL